MKGQAAKPLLATLGKPGLLHEYIATLDRVKDGDTFVLLIDLGFGCLTRQSIRVLDYNAPELGTPDGDKARLVAVRVFASAKEIRVRTYKDARTFERWLAEVWIDGVTWGAAMAAVGSRSTGLTPLDQWRSDALRFVELAP